MARKRTICHSKEGVAVWGLLGLAVLAAWGCAGVRRGGTQPTALMQATGTKTGTVNLRAMNNVLAINVPGIIEAAADRIGAETQDAATRRRALLWKIEVIPVFFQVLFYSDPLAAALDAWALSIQLEEALGSGAGRDRFGSLQPVALEAVHQIRFQIEAEARAAAKTPEGFDRGKAMVEGWAREHPILGSILSRPSMLPELARMASGHLDTDAFQAVADITASVNDVAARIDIYAIFLSKSVRWQAELIVGDIADPDYVQRLRATLASVEELSERANVLLSPEGIRTTLGTAVGQIKAELGAALVSVDRQRVETLAYLTREREAIVADVGRERDALVRQADELRQKALADLDQRTGRVIRQTALTVALLLLLAAVLTAAVIYLASRLRAKRPATS